MATGLQGGVPTITKRSFFWSGTGGSGVIYTCPVNTLCYLMIEATAYNDGGSGGISISKFQYQPAAYPGNIKDATSYRIYYSGGAFGVSGSTPWDASKGSTGEEKVVITSGGAASSPATTTTSVPFPRTLFSDMGVLFYPGDYLQAAGAGAGASAVTIYYNTIEIAAAT